ncbi:MAG: hypothetical protein ACI81R_001674 [Bradymonadia bacterium]|jgi:hypothetical protein
MRSLLSSSFFVGVIALASTAWAVEPVTPITSSQAQRAQEGDPLVSAQAGDINRGQVIGVVNAPLEDVMLILADVANHENWFPDTDHTVLISRDGNNVTFSGETHVPVLRDREWTNVATHRVDQFSALGECHIIEYEYVEGSGNLDEMYGYWLVCQNGANADQTLVKYVLAADLGIPLPNSLINWATRNMLPGVITGLQARYDAIQ